jgi:hypothetical protein
MGDEIPLVASTVFEGLKGAGRFSEWALTVAAFESFIARENPKNPRVQAQEEESRNRNENGPNSNVKTRTFCKRRKRCGTLKFKFRNKTRPRTKQINHKMSCASGIIRAQDGQMWEVRMQLGGPPAHKPYLKEVGGAEIPQRPIKSRLKPRPSNTDGTSKRRSLGWLWLRRLKAWDTRLYHSLTIHRVSGVPASQGLRQALLYAQFSRRLVASCLFLRRLECERCGHQERFLFFHTRSHSTTAAC